MRPRKPAIETAAKREQDDLFRSRLEAIIDPRHSLVRLGKAIDWSVFDTAFGKLFDQTNGRPGLPTRLATAFLHAVGIGLNIGVQKVSEKLAPLAVRASGGAIAAVGVALFVI